MGLISRWRNRLTSARIERLRQDVSKLTFEDLRPARSRMRRWRALLDNGIRHANERLLLPAVGSEQFPRPRGTDWSWRPNTWRAPLAERGVVSVASRTVIGDEITLFHDCRYNEMAFRQLRNTREADLAPFGLRLEVYEFAGTFLSLAIDLPDSACDGLKTRHLIRMEPIVQCERPIEIFARLNIKHGPNVEQIVRELDLNADHVSVEFDLGYSDLNEKRIEQAWVDLIFEGPQMNQVTIRDVTFCRYPRADL
ncbi:DUF6478 family protein [Marivivens aquimaris]|uniref:DUF6478 family protein n=1 Tax=Marivivens aquimaris TaxID=2774876 RepID=UPI001881507D|nr:DUF6478 family protein [Marivivens aquimaris]